MRTFKEVKEAMIKDRINTISHNERELENDNLMNYQKDELREKIKKCRTELDNIDEVTTIEIGAATNSLIETIQRVSQICSFTGHLKDFDEFIKTYILGITSDGRRRGGVYLGLDSCLILGININDLSCFKEFDSVRDSRAGDRFREYVNTNCGTNIPMSGVLKKALDDYEEAVDGNYDEFVIAKALMHLKETQRDSGNLKLGEKYYILATDLEYQAAKAKCKGRNR